MTCIYVLPNNNIKPFGLAVEKLFSPSLETLQSYTKSYKIEPGSLVAGVLRKKKPAKEDRLLLFLGTR